MSTAHVRRHYLRSEETVEEKVPSHYLDSRTFKVFAPMPDMVSKHGRFSFKWTRTGKLSNRYGWQHWTEIATYVSMDGTTWQPCTTWFATNKNYYDEKPYQVTRDIHDELVKVKAQFKRKRTNRLAKERRHRIKAKQEELGCTEKEAMRIIAEEKAEAKRSVATKDDIKRTKRIIAVAPLVRDLKNEVDALLAQLEADPKQVNITYVTRAKRDIRSVTNLLSDWNKGRRG